MTFKLFPHQKEGVEFLLRVKRAILADETGLGKTVTVLAACESFQKVLIVCPKYVASKWVEAASQFGETIGVFGESKKQKVKSLEQITLTTKYVVTNYESLLGDFKALNEGAWDVVIADEAQYLQNRNSRRAKSFLKLTKKTEYLFLLTATPVWNQPDSLWHLLKIIYPKEYSSFWSFVYKFCIVKETPFGKEIKGLNPATESVLRNLIKPFTLRREKKNVLGLDARVEKVVWLDVDKKLHKESRHIRRLMGENGSLSMGRTMVHLLDRESFEFEDEEKLYSSKIPSVKKVAMTDILASHEGQKILVFVRYRKSAEIVRKWVEEAKLGWVNKEPITGEMSVAEREKVVEEFREVEGTAVLVGTGRTIGTGIDLQVATVGLFLEHPSSYAELEQNIGRLERIGSKEQATIYHLIQKGTLDQRVFKACKDKQYISESILLQEEE